MPVTTVYMGDTNNFCLVLKYPFFRKYRNRMNKDIRIKTDEEIQKMRTAGYLAADVLDHVTPYVKEGVTTAELDNICHDYIILNGAAPATLNYTPPGHPPYPKSSCISVNHQVCHGIPSDERFLKDGDILNIDVTVIKDGWHGDTGRMFTVGTPSRKAMHLCEVALDCLWHGIQAVRPGARLNDIGRVIQRYAETQRYSVVRDFCGHGLGKLFHEPPQVLHFDTGNNNTPVLAPNMVFTIEPMINAGRAAVKSLSDNWTVVTRDRSLSAQWEHTVRVSEDGFEVLTLPKKDRSTE